MGKEECLTTKDPDAPYAGSIRVEELELILSSHRIGGDWDENHVFRLSTLSPAAANLEILLRKNTVSLEIERDR
jgi:hypothetical protein